MASGNQTETGKETGKETATKTGKETATETGKADRPGSAVPLSDRVQSIRETVKAAVDKGKIPDQKIRSTVGRKPALAEPPPKLRTDPETFTPAFKALGNLICERAGVKPIGQTEARQLADVWCPVLDKYLGDLMARHGELAVALTITAQIATPRAFEYSQKKKANSEPKPAAKPDPKKGPNAA